MAIVLDGTTGVNQSTVTGASVMPVGTTAERPASPTVGMIRFNTDLNALEEYRTGSSISYAGGGGGAGCCGGLPGGAGGSGAGSGGQQFGGHGRFGTSGAANFGGGGGGCLENPGSPGSGGSGIVVIRYRIA